MCLTLRAHPQQLELEAVGDGSNKKATVHFLEIANGDDPYEVSKPRAQPCASTDCLALTQQLTTCSFGC